MSNICIPKKLLSALIDMASEHVQDIESGIEDGTYSAAENEDLGDKQLALSFAEAHYQAATAAGAQGPFEIDVNKLQLQPIGRDTGGAPDSVLKGQVQIGDCSFHVEAYQVAAEEGGYVSLANPVYEVELDHLHGLSGSSSPLSSVTIGEQPYILAIFPFSR